MNGNRRGTDISDHQPLPRSGRGSDLSFDKTPEAETPPWDLRLPEEIAEDPGEYWVSNGSVKGSRIPVAKLSPAPISTDHLGRPVSRKSSIPFNDGTPLHLPKARSRSNSAANALEATPKIQPGKRSATEGSPKKGATTGARKASVTSKSGAPGRPKTRSGPSPRSTSSTRPTTRSGELSPRAPEGDPPWMVSAYKPDPRLPPDQQLLPTVAKRLQQEKWEQEGKFGSVYDKEFRPLNDESFAKPPELEKPGEIDAKEEERQEERHDEWPLRPDAKAANASRPGTSSYSTMPKIEDKPARTSPHPSPRPVQQPKMQSMQAPQNAGREGPPEQPQEKPKKAGCGCCIVM
ncbi:hypothetical protein GGR56DRAFT_99832 [Xylariaceae sp. FL0804]|nr:hypothetical protein GGR56DRAFT_99832 [Xylariaceae sp. FL0804]